MRVQAGHVIQEDQLQKWSPTMLIPSRLAEIHDIFVQLDRL
jgi:hypothetical protein